VLVALRIAHRPVEDQADTGFARSTCEGLGGLVALRMGPVARVPRERLLPQVHGRGLDVGPDHGLRHRPDVRQAEAVVQEPPVPVAQLRTYGALFARAVEHAWVGGCAEARAAHGRRIAEGRREQVVQAARLVGQSGLRLLEDVLEQRLLREIVDQAGSGGDVLRLDRAPEPAVRGDSPQMRPRAASR